MTRGPATHEAEKEAAERPTQQGAEGGKSVFYQNRSSRGRMNDIKAVVSGSTDESKYSN